MTKAKTKPRARKVKMPAETMPTEPTAPPAPICPECKRRVEIETGIRACLEGVEISVRDALKYLSGHNYTVILGYLNNAMNSLSPALSDIRKLYQEEAAKRVGD